MRLASVTDPEASRSGRSASPPVPAAESFRAQLQKILASPRFARSECSSRMLRFLVEKTLQGEADEIKEYVLGVEVLGRGDSFDPQLDPIARVEAGRLRKKLDEYFLLEGRNDPIVIELPKGRHVPAFRKRQLSAGKTAPARLWTRSIPKRQKVAVACCALVLVAITIIARVFPFPHKLGIANAAAANGRAERSPASGQVSREASAPSIVVFPFADLSPAKHQQKFSKVPTEELIATLDAIPGLRVELRASSFSYSGTPIDLRAVGRQLDVGAALGGGVLRTDNRIQITAQLINARDGSHVWSQTYDGEARDVASFERGLANAVTETLGVERARSDGARPFDTYSPRREVHDLYLMGLYHAQTVCRSVPRLLKESFPVRGTRVCRAGIRSAWELCIRSSGAIDRSPCRWGS